MKLFISYAHVDRYRVNELVEILRDASYEPWFDHRLLPGQDWKAELLRAVKMCDAFLYALSPESVESEWCQWEFSQAVEMGKPIIPVLLQARTKLPDAISRFQFADFSDGPTPRSVARLMGGLRVVQVIVPVEQAPQVTANPSGLPAQAENDSIVTNPPFTPPDVSHILPAPFEWCYVPHGGVTLKDIDDVDGSIFTGFYSSTISGGHYKVEDFLIAKYPITNDQYQMFIDDPKGYSNILFWGYSEKANQWYKENPRPEGTAYYGANVARTNVSWYESVAFCHWLNYHLGTSFEIMLPTEQQWQRAAQGDDNREYPWGDEFDPRCCNSNQSGIGKPTPVTQYPNGASPFGVFDMAGNVWEWCLTRWGDDSTAAEGDLPRVVRGGAFSYHPDYSQATYRFNFNPSFRNPFGGFRVVWIPPSSDR